jgi:DAK2 domain fusion protein YloV
MVIEIRKQVCDGHTFKWLTAAGLAWLEHNEEIVNRMNVFPVPDGDTGTNMRLTMQKAHDAVADLDEPHVGIVSDRIAKGALLGARGNSGVILSQLMRGFAEVMRSHEVFDAKRLAEGCQSAVERAYQAVIEPTEGTILTVGRLVSEALNQYVKTSDDLCEALDVMVAAAEDALQKTPDLLPVLKEAGVVDSGGQGLLFILEGMQRMTHGKPVNIGQSDVKTSNGDDWESALKPDDDEGYGYDVQFLMRGANMNVDAIRAQIDSIGWSTLVVGDSNLIKVHVHVHDPGEPLSYAIRSGATIDDIVVENMQAQYEQYVEERVNRTQHTDNKKVDGVAVIVVASGDGFIDLFSDGLNAARIITGGQTMNPSTEEFLNTIESLPNHEIILLPNNKNIILAAEQAAALARGKTVRVVPTTTIPQGISAMLAYIDMRDDTIDVVALAMKEASKIITTCEITQAVRDSRLDNLNVRQGQYIGLVNGKLVAVADDLLQSIRGALQKAGADRHELITIYYGEGLNENEAQKIVDTLAAEVPASTLELVHGGQPLYPVVIGIE